jgi:hypothetical protein
MGFNSYKGSIKLGAGLTPAADGYPLMQSCDIQVDENGKTLAEFINEQDQEDSISAAIIDVLELPTEDIRTDVFYRVPNGTFYATKSPLPWTCHIVENLPDTGEPATSDMQHFIFYYSAETGSISGYADDALGAMAGIPAGWYDITLVMPMLGASWGGIIFSEDDTPSDENTAVLLLTYKVYYYKDVWNEISNDDSERVGRFGTGFGAEVFNKSTNKAEGDFSHAEGVNTYAGGEGSHAEGVDTGADGYGAHVEGVSGYAGGEGSHAEGVNTVADGYVSHAEGYSTAAKGIAQHVQGAYNILDTENKYAHIVGNGSSSAQSNAHTLDWEGNAWFAGNIYIGGTGQEDPNAKTLTPFTTDDTLSLKDGVLSVNVAS